MYAGTHGAVALEDLYVAGRVSRSLPGVRTDAALVAEGVATRFVRHSSLGASADGRALEAVGMSDDVASCAQASVIDLPG